MKADKTRNLYKLPVAEYKKLLDQNITATVTKLNNVNKEAAEIALDWILMTEWTRTYTLMHLLQSKITKNYSQEE